MQLITSNSDYSLSHYKAHLFMLQLSCCAASCRAKRALLSMTMMQRGPAHLYRLPFCVLMFPSLKHVLLLPERHCIHVMYVLQMLPIVEQLANPALKDRHWRGVLTLLGADRAVRIPVTCLWCFQHVIFYGMHLLSPDQACSHSEQQLLSRLYPCTPATLLEVDFNRQTAVLRGLHSC